MKLTATGRPAAILGILSPIWPGTKPLLDHRNCFELLISVILSAQCTDEQVNGVTPALFAAYPDPRSLAEADPGAVAALVHATGFYRAKAAHIVGTARMIVERHGGSVPGTMEELLELPGVGRKTANLVISSCFGQPGLIVDTHVLRTARRLGLAPTDDPAASERYLAESFDREDWTRLSYALNRLGKHVCTARRPDCAACPVAELCPSAIEKT